MRVLGILLIVAGLFALVLNGVSYSRRREVARVGPVSASVRETERVAVPRYVGIALLVAGAGLLAASARRRRA